MLACVNAAIVELILCFMLPKDTDISTYLVQAWLLFLYTSLALRENILRVNGSDIRPW